MTDFFMGRELPPELPPGSHLPDVTPPEGVVFTKVGMDGYIRKYLRHSGLGSDGRRWERNLLVLETPPNTLTLPGNVMGMVRPVPGARQEVAPNSIPISGNGPRLGQISQTAPSGPPDYAGPAPLACPGPIEMPDGHTINPDDPITLKDLCDIVPYLVESLKGAMGPASRTGPVPLTGQQPGGPYATAISPPSGMFGQGGAGGGGAMMGFGGGGGGPGPRGLVGPPGIGAAPDYLTKVDGDFSAGPGAFVAVPGTQLPFVQASDGAAIFFLQACFGCSGLEAQSDQIGLRVTDSNGNATDYPLTATLLHTGVAGVGVFFQPAPGMWPVTLVAGSYTVEVILRGLSVGEFCGAAGLGFAATVSANAQVPLALVAFHR